MIKVRNKTNFINDAKKVIKPDVLSDDQLVEDAAHSMTHSDDCKFVIPEDFTTTEKDEVFEFELKDRSATDDPNEVVEDYFYIGKGE